MTPQRDRWNITTLEQWRHDALCVLTEIKARLVLEDSADQPGRPRSSFMALVVRWGELAQYVDRHLERLSELPPQMPPYVCTQCGCESFEMLFQVGGDSRARRCRQCGDTQIIDGPGT